MKSKSYLSSLLAMIMVAAMSVCVSSCDDDPADEVTVSMPSVNFGDNGGTMTVAISSNTSWTVSGAPGWLTVSPIQGSNNGAFSLTATANTDKDSRNCVLYVSAGDASAMVSVTQSGKQKATKITITNSSTYEFDRFTVHFINARNEELNTRDYGTLYPNSSITSDIPTGAVEYYVAFYDSRWYFSPNYSIEDTDLVITNSSRWTYNSSASRYPQASSAN